MKKTFYITEVFAEAPYGGNQLATLIDAHDIPEAAFQRIARAFNFSESTFFMGGDADRGFDVRIFTPTDELPFAGHPTLGSAFIAREFLGASGNEIALNLGVGRIPVTADERGVLWMRQRSPTFGEPAGPGRVADSLGLDATAIMPQLPCERVSTGLEFLIVPVRSLADLQACRPNPRLLEAPTLVFACEGYDADQAIAARMFAPGLGVMEDPATGSANGCLASYLLRHKVLGSQEIDVAVGQGYEIQRPSQLYLRASRDGETYEINVGGRVRLAGEGQWDV